MYKFKPKTENNVIKIYESEIANIRFMETIAGINE